MNEYSELKNVNETKEVKKRKSDRERLEELDKKIEQLKKQRKGISVSVAAQKRKDETKRLIIIGRIVEKYCGTIKNQKAFEEYIATFSNAIKKTQFSQPNE